MSIDQLNATTPGLIAQLKGYLQSKVQMCFSRLGYVYLRQTLSSEETIKAKRAFETFATTYGVTILQYHADNGCFAYIAFFQDLKHNNQSISFCYINAH
jgi:hypothetical protein